MNDDTQTTGNEAPAQADTVDTQASEADVQTNNQAPEATQAVEEKQTAEVKAEDTAEEKLYAGKYKSPEDMEKAYKELESKYGQTTSEKAELTKILNEAFATPEPSVQDTADDVYAEPTDNQVNPELEQIKVKLAINEFIQVHPDADVQGVQQVLQNDPMINQIQGAEARLEYAYLRSQNMTKDKAVAEAKKQGQVQAQAKIAEKQTAQVEAAQKSEKTNESGDLLEKATGNYSQAERDKARLALIRKNLVNL